MYLIRLNQLEILQDVLQQNHQFLNLNVRFFNDQINYLIFACKLQNIKIMKLLIQYGANINQTDIYKRSPIFYCVKNENFEMIKYLRLQREVDINIIDDEDQRIMDVALDTKNMQIIYELYENGALFSKNAHQKINNLLFYGVKNQNLDLIKLVCKKKPNVEKQTDKKGNNILIQSFNHKNYDFIFEMIEKLGFHELIIMPNNQKENLISVAIKSHAAEVVLKLIEYGNKYKENFKKQKYDIDIQFVDHKQQNYLQIACQTGQHALIQPLIDLNVEINNPDINNRTALILASQYDHFDCVREMLKCGYSKKNVGNLDSTLRDNNGKNARNHAKNDYVKKAITNFMIQQQQESSSIFKECMEE